MTDIIYVRVDYTHSLDGGSGSINMPFNDVPAWIAENPGVLVKWIDWDDTTASWALRQMRRDAIAKLANSL